MKPHYQVLACGVSSFYNLWAFELIVYYGFGYVPPPTSQTFVVPVDQHRPSMGPFFFLEGFKFCNVTISHCDNGFRRIFYCRSCRAFKILEPGARTSYRTSRFFLERHLPWIFRVNLSCTARSLSGIGRLAPERKKRDSSSVLSFSFMGLTRSSNHS